MFVYAISKTTELIHHLHGGVVGGEAFFTFIMTTFVLVDAWMLQTVFTNQYGKKSFLNLSIMFVKMMILLVFAGMIVEDCTTILTICVGPSHRFRSYCSCSTLCSITAMGSQEQSTFQSVVSSG